MDFPIKYISFILYLLNYLYLFKNSQFILAKMFDPTYMIGLEMYVSWFFTMKDFWF